MDADCTSLQFIFSLNNLTHIYFRFIKKIYMQWILIFRFILFYLRIRPVKYYGEE